MSIFDPFVGENLLGAGPLGGVKMEHLEKEILENKFLFKVAKNGTKQVLNKRRIETSLQPRLGPIYTHI